MAAETIDVNGGIGMTGAAEMFVISVASIIAILIRHHVTIDAFRQAMLAGAYALIHGVITLMQDELHVVFTHNR